MEANRTKRRSKPSPAGAERRKVKPLQKVRTHIQGLDEILEGGLPARRTALIVGASGTGKSVLGLEFLYRGALNGEPGIFIGFEESAEAIRKNAATLGWDLASLERKNKLFLMEARVSPDTVISGKFSLKGLLAIIDGKRKELRAKRIVIDAIEVLLRLFDDPGRMRSELHTLNDWLGEQGMTAILTVKPGRGASPSIYEEFLDSMADSVIALDQRVTNRVTTRSLRVVKCRGSSYGRNEYPFVITEDGIVVVPITTVGLMHKPFGKKVSTGNSRLDSILGGGYPRGSCVLFVGEQGTGKTLFVSIFVESVCSRGEKVLYVSFEESEEMMIHNLLSAGVDLRPARNSGRLDFITAYPESMGPEEHLIKMLNRIDAFHPDHVVVDAISACERMGGRQAAFDYLMRAINACKARGITILLTNQSRGRKDFTEISGNGISSLVDTVIRLEYVRLVGETNRILEVMKTRGSAHSTQKHEYVISDTGIDILDVYAGEGGLLTGTARLEQEVKEAIKARQREMEIKMKEREIKHLKAELETESARLREAVQTAELELAKLRLEQELEEQLQHIRKKIRGMNLNSIRDTQEKTRKET